MSTIPAGHEASTLNLADVCGPLPGGGEIASGSYHGSLSVRVEGVLSFGKGMRWALRVEKPRTNPRTGRSLKPEHVLLLVSTDGQTIPDLLHTLADAWQQGDVEINQ